VTKRAVGTNRDKTPERQDIRAGRTFWPALRRSKASRKPPITPLRRRARFRPKFRSSGASGQRKDNQEEQIEEESWWAEARILELKLSFVASKDLYTQICCGSRNQTLSLGAIAADQAPLQTSVIVHEGDRQPAVLNPG